MTESLQGSVEGSVQRIAPYGLLRDETGLDGESGYERANLMSVDAREVEKAVIAELSEWCNRLRWFADTAQEIAEEGEEGNPETHAGMARAYRNVSEFIARRAAEIDRDGLGR